MRNPNRHGIVVGLLFVLALGGCHSDDELLVQNIGTQTVLVEVIFTYGSTDYTGEEHDHEFFQVPPGGLVVQDYGAVSDMDVFITRTSDGLLIFADSFDGGDFEDDHGRIEIVVSP